MQKMFGEKQKEKRREQQNCKNFTKNNIFNYKFEKSIVIKFNYLIEKYMTKIK